MFEEVKYSPKNWKIKSIDFNSVFCEGKVKFFGDRDCNISDAIQIDINDLSESLRQAMDDIGEAIIKLEDSVYLKNRG